MITLEILYKEIRREEAICPSNNPVDQFEHLKRWFAVKLRLAGFDMDKPITQREEFMTGNIIFEQEGKDG